MKQLAIYLGLLCIVLMGCTAEAQKEVSDGPRVVWDNPVEAGRYLVTIGQCNDCHTEGYLQTEGNVPEEDWLTGSSLGWQGPWGTTYPPNLRLRVQEWDEDLWVQTLKTRTGLPPMPWMNVNKMNEQDMRAMYAYLRSLGPKGEHMPVAVAPGSVPSTPYLSLNPQNLPVATEE